MTLVDSAARISAGMVAAAAASGLVVDPGAARGTIGVPLRVALDELLPGAEPEALDAVVAHYRAHHADPGAPPITALPGAAEALAAVRASGGRVAVVSAKLEPTARDVLAEAGLAALVDVVVGDRYAEAKGHVLVELGATAYVGDHPGDVVAARTAGVEGVSVATGSHDPAALAAAGATTVLPDLRSFPAWLEGHRRRLAEAPVRERR
jgi:phosphoglycolate phosphatase